MNINSYDSELAELNEFCVPPSQDSEIVLSLPDEEPAGIVLPDGDDTGADGLLFPGVNEPGIPAPPPDTIGVCTGLLGEGADTVGLAPAAVVVLVSSGYIPVMPQL